MADDDLDFGETLRGISAGQKVFDRYVLKKILGRGGMGIVWLAHDEKLDREVALKFLPEMVAMDAEALVDLKRETRRSLDLTHPRIVRIYDLVEDERSAAIAIRPSAMSRSRFLTRALRACQAAPPSRSSWALLSCEP